MQKIASLTLFLVLITTTSCQQSSDLGNTEADLKGKTFYITDRVKDSSIIEFRDSTYIMFGRHLSEYPWRIARYENSNFLILDNIVIGITKLNSNTYDCTFLGLKDMKLKLIERENPWTKEMLLGTWIEEKWFDTKISDFPPQPNSLNDSVKNWPPAYLITQKQIISTLYGQRHSDIEFNSSNEIIRMKLWNPLNEGHEEAWRIKELTDSTMTIDRFEQKFYDSFFDWSYDIKLIKKR